MLSSWNIKERLEFYIRVGMSENKYYHVKGFLNGHTHFSYARQFHANAMEVLAIEATNV